MIKRILVYVVIFILLFIICYFIHNYLIENLNITLPFSLIKVYQFNIGFSLLVCVNFIALSTIKKIAEQLSFIYLGAILLKLILFSALFYNSIFTEEIMLISSKLSLLIPTFIFLFAEAFFVIKIIKEKQ